MSKNILLMDSSGVVHVLLENLLKKNFSDVSLHKCSSWDEAQDKFEDIGPSLIFVDGKKDMALAQQLKQNVQRDDIPVFMSVGMKESMNSLADAADVGAHMVFKRPFQPGQIIRALEGCLDIKASEQDEAELDTTTLVDEGLIDLLNSEVVPKKPMSDLEKEMSPHLKLGERPSMAEQTSGFQGSIELDENPDNREILGKSDNISIDIHTDEIKKSSSLIFDSEHKEIGQETISERFVKNIFSFKKSSYYDFLNRRTTDIPFQSDHSHNFSLPTSNDAVAKKSSAINHTPNSKTEVLTASNINLDKLTADQSLLLNKLDKPEQVSDEGEILGELNLAEGAGDISLESEVSATESFSNEGEILDEFALVEEADNSFPKEDKTSNEIAEENNSEALDIETHENEGFMKFELNDEIDSVESNADDSDNLSLDLEKIIEEPSIVAEEEVQEIAEDVAGADGSLLLDSELSAPSEEEGKDISFSFEDSGSMFEEVSSTTSEAETSEESIFEESATPEVFSVAEEEAIESAKDLNVTDGSLLLDSELSALSAEEGQSLSFSLEDSSSLFEEVSSTTTESETSDESLFEEGEKRDESSISLENPKKVESDKEFSVEQNISDSSSDEPEQIPFLFSSNFLHDTSKNSAIDKQPNLTTPAYAQTATEKEVSPDEGSSSELTDLILDTAFNGIGDDDDKDIGTAHTLELDSFWEDQLLDVELPPEQRFSAPIKHSISETSLSQKNIKSSLENNEAIADNSFEDAQKIGTPTIEANKEEQTALLMSASFNEVEIISEFGNEVIEFSDNLQTPEGEDSEFSEINLEALNTEEQSQSSEINDLLLDGDEKSSFSQQEEVFRPDDFSTKSESTNELLESIVESPFHFEWEKQFNELKDLRAESVDDSNLADFQNTQENSLVSKSGQSPLGEHSQEENLPTEEAESSLENPESLFFSPMPYEPVESDEPQNNSSSEEDSFHSEVATEELTFDSNEDMFVANESDTASEEYDSSLSSITYSEDIIKTQRQSEGSLALKAEAPQHGIVDDGTWVYFYSSEKTNNVGFGTDEVEAIFAETKNTIQPIDYEIPVETEKDDVFGSNDSSIAEFDIDQVGDEVPGFVIAEGQGMESFVDQNEPLKNSSKTIDDDLGFSGDFISDIAANNGFEEIDLTGDNDKTVSTHDGNQVSNDKSSLGDRPLEYDYISEEAIAKVISMSDFPTGLSKASPEPFQSDPVTDFTFRSDVEKTALPSNGADDPKEKLKRIWSKTKSDINDYRQTLNYQIDNILKQKEEEMDAVLKEID